MEIDRRVVLTGDYKNVIVVDKEEHIMMPIEKYFEFEAIKHRIKEIEGIRGNLSTRLRADALGCYSQEELDKLREKHKEFVAHHTVNVCSNCIMKQ